MLLVKLFIESESANVSFWVEIMEVSTKQLRDSGKILGVAGVFACFTVAALFVFSGVNKIVLSETPDAARTFLGVILAKFGLSTAVGVRAWFLAIGALEIGLGAAAIAKRSRRMAVLITSVYLVAASLAVVLARNDMLGTGCSCVGIGFLDYKSIRGILFRNGIICACCAFVVWTLNSDWGER